MRSDSPYPVVYNKVNYYMYQYPVKENEEFYLPMYVAGIGKEMEYGQTYVSENNRLSVKICGRLYKLDIKSKFND